MQVPCKSDLVLIDGVVLANREEGVAHGMEQASSYCRVVVQVDLLDDLLRMGVPEFDGVVNVQRAAEDQTLEGVPADRVHSVDMLRKFTI